MCVMQNNNYGPFLGKVIFCTSLASPVCAMSVETKPRFVPDFATDPIQVPVPTQICFFLGHVDAKQCKGTMVLVQIEGITIKEECPTQDDDSNDDDQFKYRSCAIDFLLLDDSGVPTGKSGCAMQYSDYNAPWVPHHAPTFVRAIDTWKRSTYDEMIHMLGLMNAKFMDMQQNILRLDKKFERLLGVLTKNVDQS